MVSEASVRNPEKSVAAGGRSRVGLTVLWVLAILIFGVGDIFTTAVVLGLGGSEGNAVVAGLMQMTGGSIWPLTMIKGVVICGLLLVSYTRLGSYGWLVPAGLAATGTYFLMHNIAAMMILL